MSFKVGQIIRNAMVLGKYSRTWVLQDQQNQNVRLLLQPKYSGRKILRKNEMIDSLVVIKQDGNLVYVAVENYLDDLLQHYYHYHSNNLTPTLNEWSIWYERWQQECSNCNFTTTKFSLNNTSLEKNIYKFFKLNANDYCLPIPAPKVIDSLQSSPRFYPHIIYEDDGLNNVRAGYAVYKTDGVNSFPLQYRGKLVGKSIPMEINLLICLHGFIDPYKWHFDVWKHVFNQETDRFPRCKFRSNTCEIGFCLGQNLFQNIHQNIKQECNQYFKNIVTCFESDTTKKMLSDTTKEFYTRIAIKCNGQIERKPFKQIFRGVSHNWTDKEPLIHIMPLTFYDYSGRIEDIPDGYRELKEVRKYEK
jgi:hypothetical protein